MKKSAFYFFTTMQLIVDTNCNPELIDFPIPGNDDASKSIDLILKYMCNAIEEGIQERKLDKEAHQEEVEQKKDERMATEFMEDENSDGTKRRPRRRVAVDGEEKRPRKPVAKKQAENK